MSSVPKAGRLLGWALLAAVLTVIAVIIMIVASVAFVLVAGVCILGATVTVLLMLGHHKKKRE